MTHFFFRRRLCALSQLLKVVERSYKKLVSRSVYLLAFGAPSIPIVDLLFFYSDSVFFLAPLWRSLLLRESI